MRGFTVIISLFLFIACDSIKNKEGKIKGFTRGSDTTAQEANFFLKKRKDKEDSTEITKKDQKYSVNLMTEDFDYKDISDFASKNKKSIKGSNWPMSNTIQYMPGIFDSINQDSSRVNNYLYDNIKNVSGKHLKPQDFIKIINKIKHTELVSDNDDKGISFIYQLPILNNIDRKLLTGIINNKLNTEKKKKLITHFNSKVYFSRNEIYSSRYKTKLKIDSLYEVSWNVKLDDEFHISNEPTIIGQIHNNDDFKYYSKNKTDGGVPFLNITARKVENQKRWNISAKMINKENKVLVGKSIPLELGKEYDFKIQFKMSYKEDGIIKVWVDDELIVSKNNISTHLRTVPGKKGRKKFRFGYFKIGIYHPQWNKTSRREWNKENYFYDSYENMKFITKKIKVNKVSIDCLSCLQD